MLLVISILGMIGYFYCLFLAPKDVIFLGKSINEWALIVPVMIIVYALLIIVAWIGWALTSTPSTLPLLLREDPEEG